MRLIGSVAYDRQRVAGWSAGQRVGVGWHGGKCGYCDACRRGDAFACETETLMTGVTSDGGYAEYMIARRRPSPACRTICPRRGGAADVRRHHHVQRAAQQRRPAGRGRCRARPRRARHLGVQFAAKMGFKTIAIARGQDKAPLARQLGAHHYIDSRAEDPAAALQKFGGAKVILATATSARRWMPCRAASR